MKKGPVRAGPFAFLERAEMMRLFAALAIPPEISERLTPMQRGVPGASWRPVENFHITLRFFGEISEPVARELDAELAEITAPQLELSLDGVGWFGRREPESLWAGVAESADLKALAGKCERAARRVGLPPERRPFRPHVTLAYCRGVPLEAAGAFSQRHGALRTEPFWTETFHLFSSHMGKGPARYVAEADYPLG